MMGYATVGSAVLPPHTRASRPPRRRPMTTLAQRRAELRPAVGRAWITQYGLLYLGQNIAWSGPTQILLALQVLQLAPEHYETSFAWLMTSGGLFQALGGFTGGVLSDRTRMRFGRRAPWIVMGTLSAAILLVCLAATPPYWALLALWSLFQFASYTSVNAVLALAPDTAPTRQYGVISGILGMTYTLGVVVGTLVSTSLGIGPAYVVSAALLLALTAQFLLRPDARRPAPDELDPAPEEDEGAVLIGGVLEGSIVAPADEADEADQAETAAGGARHSYADFAWVFAARFTVNLGNFIALFYLRTTCATASAWPIPTPGCSS